MDIVTKLGDFSGASHLAFREGTPVLETAALARELVKHVTSPDSVRVIESARDRGVILASMGGEEINVDRIYNLARRIYVSIETPELEIGWSTFEDAVSLAKTGSGTPLATPRLDQFVKEGGYVDSLLYNLIHAVHLAAIYDDPEFIAALTSLCADNRDLISQIPDQITAVTPQLPTHKDSAALDTL